MPMPSSPAQWTVTRVRSTFIDFFKSKPVGGAGGHTFVPSSPVVPHDDPTLLFTNAGMNQFKPIFLGQADPNSELGTLKRAVNSQKCIRAGGKHNDLDDVGKDTYHHTFFEMLGNWSFGDYFKKEAVEWSWELLTKVYGLPPAALYATYFEGNPAAGLEPDLETKALWERFLPPYRVIPGNMKDNFWEMGETGPCGPCTEIHVDRLTAMGLEKRSVPERVNVGDPDVIEIWNNVFIQYNREADRSLKLLPAKHVDTGMGLERLTSVLQNKRSNYDTDVFYPIFAEIERLTGARAYAGRLGTHDEGNVDTAYRVIADHIRTLTFAITDGAVPSNEGRGYVLRRILRRAVRYGRQVLHAKSGFFHQLVPVLVSNMGDAFPELRKNPQRVMEVIRDEEESFGKTLDRGIRLFEDAYRSAINRTRVMRMVAPGSPSISASGELDRAVQEWETRRVAHNGHPTISAEDAFQLYDTYGFPPDLTQQMAEERGMRVDMPGFEKLMEEQRERARAAGKFAADGSVKLTLGAEQTAQLARLGIKPTDDHSKFAGKDISARVEAIWDGQTFENSIRPGSIGVGRQVGIILNRTSFYSEMGGQEADSGRLHVVTESRAGAGDAGDRGEFRVESALALAGYVMHIGTVTRGEIRVGDECHASIDRHRRAAIASNHTATHLLNLCMRTVLGEGVDQKGSLVAEDRLRFDFSFGKPVAVEEIASIERLVRERVRAGLPVYSQPAPQSVARQINGLRAVFGEAYPDPVRVVSIGVPVDTLLDTPGVPTWRDYSIEFCGGTHVATTKDIGEFALASEEGIAKGVRRFIALTGVPAVAAVKAADSIADRIEAASRLHGEELAGEVQHIHSEIDVLTLPAVRKHQLRAALGDLQERVRQAQKEAAAAKSQEAANLARQIAEAASASLSDIIVNAIDIGSDRKAMQSAIATVQAICPRAAIMLFSPDRGEGKIMIMAAVPPAVIKRGLSAGEWVRVAADACGGKGGGKPDSAQGGGSDLSKLRAAIQAATTFAHQRLGA
ncbi:MAG: alanine--tRNA ligase [Phycisphaerales bacterium]